MMTSTKHGALCELLKIAHGEKDGWAFSFKAGIDSQRNLDVYIRKLGLFDGREWSYGDLANEYDISRPRAVQICQRTARLLKEYFGSPQLAA